MAAQLDQLERVVADVMRLLVVGELLSGRPRRERPGRSGRSDGSPRKIVSTRPLAITAEELLPPPEALQPASANAEARRTPRPFARAPGLRRFTSAVFPALSGRGTTLRMPVTTSTIEIAIRDAGVELGEVQSPEDDPGGRDPAVAVTTSAIAQILGAVSQGTWRPKGRSTGAAGRGRRSRGVAAPRRGSEDKGQWSAGRAISGWKFLLGRFHQWVSQERGARKGRSMEGRGRWTWQPRPRERPRTKAPSAMNEWSISGEQPRVECFCETHQPLGVTLGSTWALCAKSGPQAPGVPSRRHVAAKGGLPREIRGRKSGHWPGFLASSRSAAANAWTRSPRTAVSSIF